LNRKKNRRWDVGGISERGGRRALRGGDPARDDRPQCRYPRDKRIGFRIGVNLGDVIVEDHDIFGDGVNIAARLEALAEPGGICISRTVREQIRDKLSYPFEDMGEHSVKNIARPVHVYGMSAAAVASLPHARGVEAETGRRLIPALGMQISWTVRLLLLVIVAVLPILVIQG